MTTSQNINNILNKLSKSKFRNSFHLKEKDIKFVENKGLNTIEEHACDFINKRLKSKYIPNDGRQTPMKGHPIFIAQHATATCCRNCLYKWHRILPNKELNNEEITYIKNVILTWINNELKQNK